MVLHYYLGHQSADLHFVCQDGAITASEISDVARQLEDSIDRLSVEGAMLSTILDKS